jgi:hypothetical protein
MSRNLPEIPADNMYDDTCAKKAKDRGDLTFTLVAQDTTMATTIAYWILQNINSAPPAKLEEALRKAIAVRHNPNRKWPD